MSSFGFVEYVDCYQLRGWAADDPRTNDRLKVDVISGGTVIASGRADLFRQDLKDSGIGDGCYGFVIHLEPPRDHDEVDRILVRIELPAEIDFYLPRLAVKPPNVSVNHKLLHKTSRVSSPDARPLFVLGAARSGTSIIAQSLLNLGLYGGSEEGHIFGMLPMLQEAVHSYYESNAEEALPSRATALSHVDRRFFLSSLGSIFEEVYERLYSTPNWLDKTPGPRTIEAAPLVVELWPNASFLFLKRRGIENIVSRLRKFPSVDFSDHCDDWNRTMQAWNATKSKLGDRFLEIEHLDLEQKPYDTAKKIGAFLGFTSEQTKALGATLKSDRPERTAPVFGTIYDFQALDWSEARKCEFLDKCGKTMLDLGYSLDATYRHSG